MAKRCNLLRILFLSLIFSFHTAYAINLGTLIENDYAKVNSGSVATFTIIFWTSDEDSFDVSIVTKSKPEELFVVLPGAFTLPSSAPDRNIYLQERGYVKALAKQVSVWVPPGTPTGKYAVAVSAVAGDASPGISVAQERTFRLNIDVTGKTVANTTSEIKLPSDKKSTTNDQQNAANQVNQTPNTTVADDDSGDAPIAESAVGDPQNTPSNATAAAEGASERITGKATSPGSARAAFLALATAIIMYIAWRIYKREPKMYHYKSPTQ